MILLLRLPNGQLQACPLDRFPGKIITIHLRAALSTVGLTLRSPRITFAFSYRAQALFT